MASYSAHGGSGGRRVAVPIYQIDFTAVASGKHFASSKRRVRWRFGFANTEALDSGETGTACRGEEHDVTLVWSVTSGKRLILADGHEVHYSNIRGQQFEFSWTMKGNHVLKVIAYAAPPINPIPNFRQYDFFVDGQSFFTMPKVYRLGLNGSAPSGGHGQASMPAAHRSPTYNNYNAGNDRRGDSTNIVNLEAPQNEDEEEAFLKRALEESMQDAQPPAQAPAPAPVQTDLLDFGEGVPGPAPAQIGYTIESTAITGPVATESVWSQQSWGQPSQPDALVPSRQATNQYQIAGAPPQVGAYAGFNQSFNASSSNGYANQQSNSTTSLSAAPYQPNTAGLDPSPYAQSSSPFAPTSADLTFDSQPPALDSGPSVPDTKPLALGCDFGNQGVSSMSAPAPAPFVAPIPSVTGNRAGNPSATTESVENVFSSGYGAAPAEAENVIGTSRSAEDAYNKIKMGEFSLDTKAAVNPFDIAPKQQRASNVQNQNTEKKRVMNAPPGAMVVSSQQGGNWGGAVNTYGGGYSQPQQGTGGNMHGTAFQQPQYGGQPMHNNTQQTQMQPGQMGQHYNQQPINQQPPYNQHQQQWQSGSQGNNNQFQGGF